MTIVLAATRLPFESGLMNKQTHTTHETDNRHESTYSLLIHSAEKSRNRFEVVIYPLLVLGPLLAAWQFASQPINVRAAGYRAESPGNKIVAVSVSQQPATPPNSHDPVIKPRCNALTIQRFNGSTLQPFNVATS
jgi:hypothetical protein